MAEQALPVKPPEEISANQALPRAVLTYVLYAFSLLAGISVGFLLVPNYLYQYFVSPPYGSRFASNIADEISQIENTEFSGLAYSYVDFYIDEFPQEIINHHYIPNVLTTLKIESSGIKSIPSDIEKLSLLEILNIQDSKLEELPSQIGNLTNLKELKLGGNNLKSLPSEIGRLSNLELLHLYDNQLESLPSEIGNLANLKVLDLHTNRLTTLPESIANLTNLEVLYLGGNSLPEEEKQKVRNLLPTTKIYF